MDPIDTDWLLAELRAALATHARPRFLQLDPGDVSEKSAPDDLVTAADLAIEAALTQAIRARHPEVEVIGEEAVAADPTRLDRLSEAERAVILDPIDGTWNFVHGLPAWGAILAVVERGETVWGGLVDGLTGHLMAARRGGGLGPARRFNRPFQPGDLVGYLPMGLLPAGLRPACAALIPRLGRVQSLRCSCHEYRLVASGAADWVLGWALKPWDHAAGALAVAEAGGMARCLDGRPYGPTVRHGPLLSARTPEIWEHVAALLRPVLAPEA